MAINTSTGMSDNTISVNTKTMMIAAEAADAMPYIKASKSYMTESDLKGKKYGNTYSIYLTDPGTAHDGIVVDPDSITEVTCNVTLENANTSVQLDAWNRFSQLEDFDSEVARPKGIMLAKTTQKKVINSTYPMALNAVAGAVDLATLSAGAAVLRDNAVPGTMSSFIKPQIAAQLSALALGKFLPDDVRKQMYQNFYVGEFGDSSIVNVAGLPVVSTSGISSAAATIALTAVTDGSGATIGYAPVTTVTGTGLKQGWAFQVSGLNIVGVDGVSTTNPVTIVLGAVNSAGTSATITPLRITVEGNRYNNPNAVVDTAFGAATASLTPLAAFTAVGASTTWAVGIAREDDALAFDQYVLCDKLPGGEFSRQTVDGITVQMSQWGNGTNLSSLLRLDLAYAAAVPDPRRQCLVYFAQ